MQPWLEQLIRWLGEIWEWTSGGRRGKPPHPPHPALVHNFTLSGQVNDWFHDPKRTDVERRAFGCLLLALDADPFIGQPMLRQASPGQRSVGFAAGHRGYGVIYQVHAAASPIRLVSIVPP